MLLELTSIVFLSFVVFLIATFAGPKPRKVLVYDDEFECWWDAPTLLTPRPIYYLCPRYCDARR